MSRQRKRRFFLFYALMLCMVVGAMELLGWAFINLLNPDYEKVRQILLGNETHIGQQNMVSQPYLLYTPSPGLSFSGAVQHNGQGYRGDSVPVQKPPDVFRILFMGGSTTYSMSVIEPQNTYPAQVGRLLNGWVGAGELDISPFGRVDVINAGLPWGTSAEILTHYLLKYRYYKPDMVVINTGGNDAYSHFLGATYQPDYAHFRKTMEDVSAIRKPFRYLFHSRFFSVFYIAISYEDAINGNQFVHDGSHPFTRWLDCEKEGIDCVHDTDYNAFYNNITTAVQAMGADGAEVVLVPFHANWEHEVYKGFRGDSVVIYTVYYNQMLRNIAHRQGLAFVPFDESVITDVSMFKDDCHLDEEGTLLKARHIARHIAEIIRADRPSEGELDESDMP